MLEIGSFLVDNFMSQIVEKYPGPLKCQQISDYSTYVRNISTAT